MEQILHEHHMDGIYHKDCKRCIMERAAPEMYWALKEAEKLIRIARQYFPKSIKNTDTFSLENTGAAIGKAIAKVEIR